MYGMLYGGNQKQALQSHVIQTRVGLGVVTCVLYTMSVSTYKCTNPSGLVIKTFVLRPTIIRYPPPPPPPFHLTVRRVRRMFRVA